MKIRVSMNYDFSEDCLRKMCEEYNRAWDKYLTFEEYCDYLIKEKDEIIETAYEERGVDSVDIKIIE